MARGQRKTIEEKLAEKERLIDSLKIRLRSEQRELEELRKEQREAEMKALQDQGVEISPRNLKISDKAIVCLPYHKMQDIMEEDRLADKKFGSTRRGIAPVYADKYMKKGVRMEDLLHLGREAYLDGGAEFFGACSFMKAGLNFADRITTVSPTYAQEIQTAYYGEKLDGLMRAKADRLVGILNGIDMAEYDPSTDPLIEMDYSWRSIGRKQKNKALLQEELGLEVEENVPMIGMVGRLSGQKGLDLVQCVLNEIMATGVQLVVLGKGDDNYVSMFRSAQMRYPGRLAARIEMNNQLAHRIYAAIDLFLMPSRFEPFGLSQMIALRYGALPIVRETGGLRDTVIAYNEFTDEGNGFSFANYNAHDMLHVVEYAVRVYRSEPKTFQRLVRRAMRGQYGWDQSARVYLDMYRGLTGEKAEKSAE